MRGVRAGRRRARSTGWAAARAYLGADATARRAHTTCIATCALVRVCFEVNEGRVNIKEFRPHPSGTSRGLGPECFRHPLRRRRRIRSHAAVSPVTMPTHVACSPALSAHQTLRRAKGPARRDRRCVSARAIARNATSADDASGEAASRSFAPTRRVALSSALALAVSFRASGIGAPPDAAAFGGEIALSDVSYEPSPCPPNQYVPNKKNTVCLTFRAVATNTLKRSVEAANIFGFVEDKQGNSAVTVNPTGTSRTVLSGLDAPIPPGKSEVSFVVTVFKDSLDLGPLKLRGFKAEPSRSDIEKRFKPFDECEMDPAADGCAGAF